MQRTCPRDGTVLVEQHAQGLNVDVCPVCFGSFFDGVELRRIAGQRDLALALGTRHGHAAAPRACCACGQPMHLDVTQGVELDHCENCLGVWLDAGELDRLATPPSDDAPASGHATALERTLRSIVARLQRAR